jgi:hypothetical protein
VLAIVTGGRAARVPERLSSWGIAPFRVADALKAVVAQRLVSRVCPKCKSDASANVPSEALIEAGFQRDEIGCLPIMKGKGCSNCNGTGCKSWVGIYEVMEVSEDIRELITTGASGIEIERKALEDGMLGLRTSGLEKIRCGVATIEEVQRQAPLFSAAIQADAGAELSVLSPGPPERVVAVAAERVRQQSAKLDQLESELQRANAEIDSLRERLFAEEHPHVASVRLADAHSEIETLRQCLFELNAFRIACEQWADGQARPRWRVARETVAAVEKRLERDL